MAKLLWIAALGPLALVMFVLVPFFHRVQRIGLPAGSLEGIDLTPFARRDSVLELLFFALTLLFALVIARRAPTRDGRMLVGAVGVGSALVGAVLFFAATFAG